MLEKIIAKSNITIVKNNSKQDNCQSQMFQVSKLSVPSDSNEVLSAWFKFQAKIPTRCGVFRKSD